MSPLPLGQRLRSLRKERRWSLAHVAGQAEISVAYLSKLELEQSTPSIDVLSKLAGVFGMSVDELLRGTSAQGTPPELPPSLEAFLERYARLHPELEQADWRATLGGIRFRGRTPEDENDWLAIFLDLKRALGDR